MIIKIILLNNNITSKIDQTLKQKKKHDQTYKDHNKKQFNLILKKTMKII